MAAGVRASGAGAEKGKKRGEEKEKRAAKKNGGGGSGEDGGINTGTSAKVEKG